MNGSKAKALRRRALLTATCENAYILMEGARTRPGHWEGTRFNYIINKPGSPRAIYRRLKDDSKSN